jgi:hypothetical protein
MKNGLPIPITLISVLACSSQAAANVPLTQEALYVGGTTGITRTNEPFCVGVPVADGASTGATGTSAFGLTEAAAGQFRVLSTWPSGRAKWVKTCGILASLGAGPIGTVTPTSSGIGNFGGSNLATDNCATITVTPGSAAAPTWTSAATDKSQSSMAAIFYP